MHGKLFSAADSHLPRRSRTLDVALQRALLPLLLMCMLLLGVICFTEKACGKVATRGRRGAKLPGRRDVGKEGCRAAESAARREAPAGHEQLDAQARRHWHHAACVAERHKLAVGAPLNALVHLCANNGLSLPTRQLPRSTAPCTAQSHRGHV